MRLCEKCGRTVRLSGDIAPQSHLILCPEDFETWCKESLDASVKYISEAEFGRIETGPLRDEKGRDVVFARVA